MAQGSSNPTSNLQKVAGTSVDTNTGNASAGTQRVVLASNQPAVAVTGTFYQATQPVSGTFWPTTQPVSGTFWQATQPVSLTSLPALATGTNAIGSITNTSFAATQSGTWNIGTVTNLSQLGGTAISMNTGVRDAGTQRVTIATNDSIAVTGTFYQATQPVSGTFWQTTQPVSGTVSINAIPAGTNAIGSITNTSFAATQSGTWNIGTVTNLSQLGGTAISMNTGVRDAGTQRVTIATNDSVPVTGTFWQTTQPVSAAALPLPTGAATSAKQPALGTAGTASADVITVQGIAGGVAQPVSGSVTVTQATAGNLNATVTGTVELGATSLAALENISVTVPGTVDLGTVSLTALETITVTSGTPGNFQSRGYGAVTTAAPAYTTGTDNALSLTTSGALRVDNSAVTQPVSGTFWPTTQPVSGPLTDAQLRATAVPITGTVTNLSQLGGTAISMNTGVRDAGTQRVTIATNDSVPVTGTFWQTTQPVSGPLTDSQLRAAAVPVTGTITSLTQMNGQAISMNTGVRDAGTQRVTIATNDSVPVTGTFWQTTQPVSGPLTDSQLRAAAVPVTGTITSLTQMNGQAISMNTGVRDAGTQRVTIATNDSVPVTGTFWQTTQPVSGPLTDAQLRAAAVPVSQSGVWTVQPGNTANTTPWLIKPLESLGTATVLGGVNVEIAQALNGNLGAAAVITAIAAPVGITLTPYASYDGGTNWTVTQFFNSANGDAISTLTTFAVGDSYSISAGDGATHVKVKVTAVSTGTVTVRLSATNSQGLVNLKSTAVHDEAAGSFVQQMGAVASSTAPTAVSANGDAVRLWATTSGALNVADGGGSITVDGTFWQATQPVSLASVPTHGVTGTFWQATQPVSIATMPSTPVTGTFWQATQPVSLTSLPALAAGTAAIGTVTAVGATASGATSTDNPVVVGGVDGGGLARPILVATDGAVKLGASTAAVGKLTANAGVIVGAVELTGATTNSLTNTTTTAYAASLIIKASAGKLYTLNGYNSKTSGQFIQLHNSATLPADTAVPVVTFYVPASSNFSFDWGVYGRAFSAGIVVSTSSTGPTKTIGAADCWFDATYK